MSRDKSVNKSSLLKRFLDDLNNIEYNPKASKLHSLKREKPKSFALPIRPNLLNQKFVMPKESAKAKQSIVKRLKSPELFRPDPNVFEPEINIHEGNFTIQNCISFTNVQSSTPMNSIGTKVSDKPLGINFSNRLASTRIDERQNLKYFEISDLCRATQKTTNICCPFEGQEREFRRKTIYDYAADYTINDNSDEDQFVKLKHHVNKNILDRLDPKTFRSSNQCEKILERINRYRKVNILDRRQETEPAREFCTPKNVSVIPSILNETPSTKPPKIFEYDDESEFFELECIRQEEFLWVNSNPQRIKEIEKKHIKEHKQNNLRDSTFFEKPDFDEEFRKFFSFQ